MTRAAPRLYLPIVMLALLAGGARAEEPLLLSQDAGGVLQLEGERRLKVSGLHGRLVLRQGKSNELRFAARKVDERETERPVALWLEARTLHLKPLAGQQDEPLWLEVSVPPELEAVVEVSDSRVDLSGLRGAIRVSGERLELIGRSIEGSLALEVADSSVQVVSVVEEVSLEGTELDVRMENVGPVSLSVEDATVRLNHVHGEVEADVENADVIAQNVQGRIRLDATTGTLSVMSCQAGAELRLTDTTLEMKQTRGSIEIDTDAQVRFQGHDGPLNIRGRGSPVLGSQAAGGALSIETDAAEVRLEELGGSTMIRGDGLDVHVTGSKGELTISTTASNIQVDMAETSVTVENDFGDVEIHEASKLVQVFSRDGDVRADGLKGPVQISADGPQVDLQWVALEGSETSSVENTRGDVRVRIPTNFRCRIDAEAPHGRVRSDIEELHVSDDGHFASGLLRGGRGAAPHIKKPTIRVKAAGDLYLDAAGPLASQR